MHEVLIRKLSLKLEVLIEKVTKMEERLRHLETLLEVGKNPKDDLIQFTSGNDEWWK